MDYAALYQKKLTSAAEAVKVVKSGDWVDYGWCTNHPYTLDKALAACQNELKDVKVRGGVTMWMPEICKAEDAGEHFTWNSWHCSGIDRKIISKGMGYFIPMRYSELPRFYRDGNATVDVAMIQVTPMDKHGNFSYALACSHLADMLDAAKTVIVEVNENLPWVYGLNGCEINIKDVDMVVEGENPPVAQLGAGGAPTEGDTAVTPIDYGCFASRTTYVVGRAVQDAANALRKKMLHAASELLDVPEDELFLNDSHILRVGQDEPLLSFAELAKKSMHTHAGNLTAYASYSNVTNPGVTGAHFAHVEVDTWTGFTKVLDYLAVHDIGQAINPGLCEAQIQGAVQMGCGAALREKMTMQKDGRCTESLSKYHLFLANDLPNIRVELLQDGRSKEGPFGAKSIGEVCYVPVAPAVCGAVNDALHANLSVLPYDPDCILKYLAEVRENHDA